MVQATIANSTVGPTHKILIGSAVTGELEASSAESAATIIGNILADSASRSLDKYVFDNVAADATRPAGLLNGVTPAHRRCRRVNGQGHHRPRSGNRECRGTS
jgi:hypothetical protein